MVDMITYKPNLPFLILDFLVLLAVVQNMIGVACNSKIPQANMHAVLNFVHAKIAAIILLFLFESFAS
jgi:hypothetical protein